MLTSPSRRRPRLRHGSQRRRWLRAAVALVALSSSSLSASDAVGAAADSPWAEVLTRHARAGGLDYAALAESPAALDRFLEGIAEADPSGLDEAAATAFWINAYNAVAARFVVDRYPQIRSVRDVDGFFDGQTRRVAGRAMTLDELEDRALEQGGARVHFAINCASQSCPGLREEPYEASRLERQLEEQVDRFLRDEEHGLRLDSAADELWLSSIFKWYAGDFTGGSTVVAFFMRGGVLEWIVENAPETIARRIGASAPRIRYFEYDWSLNDRPAATPQ